MFRRDSVAFLTLRAQSGFAAPPPEPTEPKPRDLERFFGELEARFRASAIENLAAIQKKSPMVNETAKRMFARSAEEDRRKRASDRPSGRKTCKEGGKDMQPLRCTESHRKKLPHSSFWFSIRGGKVRSKETTTYRRLKISNSAEVGYGRPT